MTNVVNLNKAKKAKDRETAKSQAAENRIRFGRAKGEKVAAKAKKARDRAAAKIQAAENRAKFGRAKSEKVAAKAAADKASRALDGAKRED